LSVELRVSFFTVALAAIGTYNQTLVLCVNR
jgi:hypothetical protein